MHSNASDGALAPKAVVQRVFESGIKAFSLTDHDTLAGLKEAQSEAARCGLEFLPGLEMSLEFKGHPIHLLVYGPLTETPEVLALVSVIQGRNRLFLTAFQNSLAHAGIDMKMEKTGLRSVGKTLAALKVLVISVKKNDAKQVWSRAREQAVTSMGPPLTAAKGLAVLRPSKAVTALAHPAKGPGQGAIGIDEVTELKDMGLQGLEVYHGRQDVAQRKIYEEIAHSLDLFSFGGSDCHFRNRWPQLGSGGMSEKTYRKVVEILATSE